MSGSSPQVRRNRQVWNTISGWYQDRHGPQLNNRPMAWGVWAVPETEARAFLGYGDWLRLFRRHGFEVEDHIELRPGEAASTCYDMVTADRARRWPAEAIWVVTRRQAGCSG